MPRRGGTEMHGKWKKKKKKKKKREKTSGAVNKES
jgi:hypothetical protein